MAERTELLPTSSRSANVFPLKTETSGPFIYSGSFVVAAPNRFANSFVVAVSVTVAFVGAVQDHQSVLPLAPSESHSPGSLVANSLLPEICAEFPVSIVRRLKLSLAGARLPTDGES